MGSETVFRCDLCGAYLGSRNVGVFLATSTDQYSFNKLYKTVEQQMPRGLDVNKINELGIKVLCLEVCFPKLRGKFEALVADEFEKGVKRA